MQLRTSAVVLLLSLSSLAFATDHCGNDPTKPDPVPFRCNGVTAAAYQPLGFRVVDPDCDCGNREYCTGYNRAMAILKGTPMHGRHGHGAHGWTAFMQWDVPADMPKNQTVIITVVPGLQVIQGGNVIKPNKHRESLIDVPEFTINFSDGFLVVQPDDSPAGMGLNQPNPNEEEPMKGELRGGDRYAPGRKGVEEPTCVSPKCSPDAIPYSRYRVSKGVDGKCYGRKGVEVPCADEEKFSWYTEVPTLKHPE